jgi:hypothetical protein
MKRSTISVFPNSAKKFLLYDFFYLTLKIMDIDPKNLRKVSKLVKGKRGQKDRTATYVVFNRAELEFHIGEMLRHDHGVNNKGNPTPLPVLIKDMLLDVFDRNIDTSDPSKVLVEVEITPRKQGRQAKALPSFLDYPTVKEYFEDYLKLYITSKHLGLIEAHDPEYDTKVKEDLNRTWEDMLEGYKGRTLQFYGLTMYDRTTKQTFSKIGSTRNIFTRLKNHRARIELCARKEGHQIEYKFAFFALQKDYPNIIETTFKASCPSLIYNPAREYIKTVEFLFRPKKDKDPNKELEIIITDEGRVLLSSLNEFYYDKDRIGDYINNRFKEKEIPAVWDNLLEHVDVQVKNGRVVVTPVKECSVQTKNFIQKMFDIKSSGDFVENRKITNKNNKKGLLESAMTENHMYILWEKLSNTKLFPTLYKYNDEFREWWRDVNPNTRKKTKRTMATPSSDPEMEM